MQQWTDERRAYYAALIRARKPWKKSTGAKTIEGKEKSKMNALKDGVNRKHLTEITAILRKQKEWLE